MTKEKGEMWEKIKGETKTKIRKKERRRGNKTR